MAEKGWTARIATAAGVAAGTGAAQLGLGYGLGVVVWPVLPTADDSVWLGSLGWATWIAANATVFGAIIAGRLGRAGGGPWRFALATSAAVGALLTVALIALPARTAVRTEAFPPQTVAGGYAVAGVILGLLIAYWAVVSRPVAANLIATAAWLWSLAVAAVVASIFWHRPSATYLSSWQFAAQEAPDAAISWPAALSTLVAALLLGVIGVLGAVRRGDLGTGAATSGAVGPLLMAAAFFVLSPRLSGALGSLESAYLIAPYAVLAGLAGSALTVGFGRRLADRRAARTAGPAGSTGASALDGDPRFEDADQVSGAKAAGAPGSARGGLGSAERRGSGAGGAVGATGSGVGGSAARGKAAGAGESTPAGGRSSRPAARGKSARSEVKAYIEGTGAEGADSSLGAGSSSAVVPAQPAPRRGLPAAAASPESTTSTASSASSAPEKPSHSAAIGPETSDPSPSAGRRRPSFLGRLWRSSAAQSDAEEAVATGRAKAPTSSPAADPPAPRKPSTSPASGPTASGSTASGPTALTTPPTAPDPIAPPPTAPAPASAAVPVTPRGKAQVARPSTPSRADAGAGSARSATEAAGSGSGPGAGASGRSDSRSTVKPPPAAPPVAQINPPRPGEPTARAGTARPVAAPNAASSDITPASDKLPTTDSARPESAARSAAKSPQRPSTADSGRSPAAGRDRSPGTGQNRPLDAGQDRPPGNGQDRSPGAGQDRSSPPASAPDKTTAAKAAPERATPSTPSKTTAAKSTPAKATAAKATPAKATPAKATPAKATPARKAPAKAARAEAVTPAQDATPRKSTPATPDRVTDESEPPTVEIAIKDDKGAAPLWVDDTEELPAAEPKRRGLRRFGRRSGDDQG